MSTVWDLVKEGKYEDACVAADREAAKSLSLGPLRNKVYALLHLERYEETAKLCLDLIERRKGETDSDFISLGICHWVLGRHDEAVAAWQAACKTKYTDAAGGVGPPLFLIYASSKLGDKKLRGKCITQLRRRFKSRAACNWPGPLAGFAIGKLTEEEVRAAVDSTPILRERQTCQAAFHIGVQRWIDGDEAGFFEHMQECQEQGAISPLEEEYYLARAELAQRS